MSMCVPADDDSASEDTGGPVREMYEQKAVSKVVRVLTVLAYLLSVSLAAILLSVYYICVWQAPTPVDDSAVASPDAVRGHPDEYILQFNDTGRSNTTVNETDNQLLATPTVPETSEAVATTVQTAAAGVSQATDAADTMGPPDNTTGDANYTAVTSVT